MWLYFPVIFGKIFLSLAFNVDLEKSTLFEPNVKSGKYIGLTVVGLSADVKLGFSQKLLL